MKKKCPTCNSSEEVREFLYGMPSEEPDPKKYVVGGCFISDDMPDYRCLSCSTDFYKNGQIYQNRFVSDGTGINWKCKDCQEWIPGEVFDLHVCAEKVDPWANY